MTNQPTPDEQQVIQREYAGLTVEEAERKAADAGLRTGILHVGRAWRGTFRDDRLLLLVDDAGNLLNVRLG